ncbi:MAG: hypothetical protein BWY33_01950 [Candidatus Dependentiae bacterium ADurb.Bin246]|nr:MAG: hypothetical protein BWY33_01950 [Candidatus Dependentiae bacterium ADurb.Bin246]
MKNKVLLLLLILNVFPIFVVAQTNISTATVNIDNLKQIEILEKIESNLQSINKKSLNVEEIKTLLKQDKKEEKNSPIWMITLIVSLYVGIFIFLSIPARNIQDIPLAMGKLLSTKLNTIISLCFSGIAILFIPIWSDDIRIFYLIIICNLFLIFSCVIYSINSLNMKNLIQKLFMSDPKAFKNSIEFYINKEDFAKAYNLFNSITLNDENNNELFNKLKMKLNLKKDCSKTIEKSISAIQSVFEDENLVYKKITYRDFFRIYIEILFKTNNLKFIKKEINKFLIHIAGLRELEWEYSQKLYENGNENLIFIVEQSVKNSYIDEKNELIQFLMEKLMSFSCRLIKDKKVNSIRYMFAEMKKIIFLEKFSESHFQILNNELKQILIKKHSDIKINHIIMYFLYRVIINCMIRNISSNLIIDLIKAEHDFVVNKCSDSHWSKYLNEFKKTNTQQEVAEFLKQY